MTRVVHTGDTHLGYEQYHAPERRQDFLEAFRDVIEAAIEADVDAVVHAGDLFDDRRPALPDLLATVSVLRELEAAAIPFLAVVGNHEGTRHGQWLDLLETFGLASRLSSAGTAVGETTFYGLDYVSEASREQLDYEFEPPDTQYAALVSHGQFAPLTAGSWDLEAVLAQSPVEFDAVLLGDEHEAMRTEIADTWVTYCGSTERASASERDARGYNLLTFDEGVQIARKGLDTRSFVYVDVELAPAEGQPRVLERIREEAIQDSVVLVSIEGEGEAVTPAEIESFADERGALLSRVYDRREHEAGALATEVSFADPDDAVRERLSELGLSEAGHELDSIVREPEAVVDSNVRATAEEAVRSLLEENPSAFETPDSGPAADTEATPTPEDELLADPDSDDPAGAEPTGSEPAEETAQTAASPDSKDSDTSSEDASANATMEEFQ